MGLTEYSYNTFVSDNLSNLRKPEIRMIYLNDKSSKYISNLVLKQIFNKSYKDEMYPIIFAITRKVPFLNNQYNSFCFNLKRLNPDKREMDKYFDVLFKCETILLIVGQIINLIKHLAGQDLFEKNDNSIYQRAYSLHNSIKHEENELIEKKKLQVIELDNKRIFNSNNELTYDELRDLIIFINKAVQGILELNTK